MTTPQQNTGRSSTEIAKAIRKTIRSGKIPAGQYLPTVRELTEKYGVANRTILRALKTLEAEGCVRSEPRHGYRVLAQANDPDLGAPIAYILSAQETNKPWSGFFQQMLSSVQNAASTRGWSTLGIGLKDTSMKEAIERCVAARAWGVVIDEHSSVLAQAAERAGLIAVMIDAWHVDAKTDAVLQDGLQGGYLAGRYLAERGHENVGWVGPINESVHAMTRYSGAVQGLRSAGVFLSDDNIVEVSEREGLGSLDKLFTGPDRPTAILSLWRNRCIEIAAAAKAAGLNPGPDLELVGWCADEQYEDSFVSHFNGYVPPAITWNMETLARTAMERLAERRNTPDLPPMRINIETKLKFHDQIVNARRSTDR